MENLGQLQSLNLKYTRFTGQSISEFVWAQPGSDVIGCHVALQGEISAQQIKWLSGIKDKNLSGCGRFTLAEDLSSIADITCVDLSNMDSLEGEVRSVGATFLSRDWWKQVIFNRSRI